MSKWPLDCWRSGHESHRKSLGSDGDKSTEQATLDKKQRRTVANCQQIWNNINLFDADAATPRFKQEDITPVTDFFLLIKKEQRKTSLCYFLCSFDFYSLKNIISMSCHWYNTKPQKCDFYFSTFCWRKFAVWSIINAELSFWYENFGNWISFPMIYNNN